MKKIIIIPFLIIFISSYAKNDSTLNKKFSIEIMVNSLFNDEYVREISALRQTVNNNYGNYYSLGANANGFFIDLRLQYNIIPRLSVSSGLRFTEGFYSFENTYINKINSNLQIKYRDDETGIYYANVNYIKENKAYVGIPIILVYRAINAKYVGLDLDLNTAFNYKLYSSLSIDFTNETMNEIKNEAISAIKENKVKDYYWSAGIGLMLRLGKLDCVHGKLGFDFPAVHVFDNYLIKGDISQCFNIKTSIVVPLNL